MGWVTEQSHPAEYGEEIFLMSPEGMRSQYNWRTTGTCSSEAVSLFRRPLQNMPRFDTANESTEEPETWLYGPCNSAGSVPSLSMLDVRSMLKSAALETSFLSAVSLRMKS
jgi:hypothetical protein